MAKRRIEPFLIFPCSMIALVPFRYLWNNPPSFVGQNLWLALLTPITAFVVVDLGLWYVAMLCWRRWKSSPK